MASSPVPLRRPSGCPMSPAPGGASLAPARGDRGCDLARSRSPPRGRPLRRRLPGAGQRLCLLCRCAVCWDPGFQHSGAKRGAARAGRPGGARPRSGAVRLLPIGAPGAPQPSGHGSSAGQEGAGCGGGWRVSAAFWALARHIPSLPPWAEPPRRRLQPWELPSAGRSRLPWGAETWRMDLALAAGERSGSRCLHAHARTQPAPSRSHRGAQEWLLPLPAP